MDAVRQAAFEILNRVERDNAYSNLLLKEYVTRANLGARDAAFVQQLVGGVLERLYTLDYQLSACLRQPLKKLKPRVRTALRLGAYQILYMEKVPVSAAVNESVELVKRADAAFAAGLVNAVLREVARRGETYPERGADAAAYYEIRYSYPRETAAMLIANYGESAAEGIMARSLGRSKMFGRLNTVKTDFEGLRQALAGTGAEITPCAELDTAFAFSYAGDLTKLSAFRDGLFFVQDLSSQLCAAAVNARAGESVIDVCASPGGKAFSMAIDMENRGQLFACDIHKHKIKLLQEGAGRLGLTMLEPRLRDAANPQDDTLPVADRVLCDVPCSGLGVAGRKPEIKYKPLSDFATLPDLQYSILRASARLVKPGGILTYSTCTLNPAENDGVCERFAAEHPDFRPLCVLPDLPGRSGADTLTILPQSFSSDGFFVAQFERRS